MKTYLFRRTENGIWYILTKHPDGTQTRISTGKKKKAEAMSSEEYLRVLTNAPVTTSLTLKDFFVQFIAYSQDRRSKGTLVMNKLYCFLSIVGDKQLTDICLVDVDRYEASQLNLFSHVPVYRYTCVLYTLFFAITRRLLNRSPFEGFVIHTPKTNPSRLTYEDFMKLLKGMDKPWYRERVCRKDFLILACTLTL